MWDIYQQIKTLYFTIAVRFVIAIYLSIKVGWFYYYFANVCQCKAWLHLQISLKLRLQSCIRKFAYKTSIARKKYYKLIISICFSYRNALTRQSIECEYWSKPWLEAITLSLCSSCFAPPVSIIRAIEKNKSTKCVIRLYRSKRRPLWWGVHLVPTLKPFVLL